MGLNKIRKSIFFALLLTGVTAVSSQIILIRELFTVFYGNELSIGFALAIWLFGGAIGSGLLGNFFSGRIWAKNEFFSSIQIILGILLPSGIILARIPNLIFNIGAGEIIGLPFFIFFSSVVLLPITILLGFLFVIGCGMLPHGDSGERIGRVYTLEAIGSLAGGAVTSLVLIRFFGALELSFILSALNLFSAFILRGKNRAVSLMLLCVLILFASFGGVGYLSKKTLGLRWKGFEVLGSRDSIYGRITVTKREGGTNFFDNGLFLFSTRDRQAAEEAVHFPMSFAASPKSVLLIGGGSGEAMNEILKYPVEKVDYVELNPILVSFSEKFLKNEPFYRMSDPRVNIINEDGRYFIKNTKNLYDALIINLPNPYTAQINRFYTREFFREAKRVLSQNAILCFGVTSSENYMSDAQALFLKTLFETASSEFAEVKIVPGDTAYFLLSNKKGSISLNSGAILAHLAAHGINTTYVSRNYLFAKLSEERLNYFRSRMLEAGSAGINRDFYPISYFYDMVLWSTYFSFKLSNLFLHITKKTIVLFSALCFLALLAVFFARRHNKGYKKEAAILALSTTGLSEISFEILIILAFQIIYGYLYYNLGIIVTAFMFGLALGSAYMTRRISKVSAAFPLYISVQMLVLIYPVILLLCFYLFSSLSAYRIPNQLGPYLFSALPFVAGFVGGIQYPLANKICLESGGRSGQNTEKTAGATYAADLLGSFIGAFLVSAFLVPIAGIPVACALITALNAVTLAILLLAKNSQ